MPPEWSPSDLRPDEIVAVAGEWLVNGRLSQLLFGAQPRLLLAMGGRGAGKTRMGAEWANCLARGFRPFAPDGRHGLIALVGETLADVREVMVEGPSGILALADSRPRQFVVPRFEPSRRRLVWPNGAVAQMFSSEDPESLRGPQFDAAWCDEAGKWKNAEATYDMLQFGLRLGTRPRQIVTTTPRATPLMRRLMADPDTVMRLLRTRDNAGHLAEGFIEAIEARYRDTRLGRQELDGELIQDRDDAMWTRDMVEGCHIDVRPPLRRIVVAVDPPASAGRRSDACGIVAAGLDEMDGVVVLADETRRAAKPADWARAAAALFHRLEADTIVAEVNQGGDMVTAVLRMIDPALPVKAVRASRAKWVRAEPVAALYAQKKVRHAGRFPKLEDEMCDFGRNGLSDGRSPDRLDALVWAVTELALRERAEPRVRVL